METLLQDLRIALRTLRASPGYAAVAVVTLALAIGANTAIFSVVNAVALRPLSYPDPERLVVLWSAKDGGQWLASLPDFMDWRERSRTFSAVSLVDPLRASLTGEDEPEQIMATRVSPEFFEVMGVGPALGRAFTAEEARPGAEPVVVLAHGLWQRRFGGDRGILGRTVTLDASSYRVIGVMPETFRIVYLGDPQAWMIRPVADDELAPDERAVRKVRVIARLKAGVPLARAQTEMAGIGAALAREYPEADGGWGIQVVSLLEDYVGPVRTNLYLVLGLVGLVLLVACANLTNLVLARSVARRRELALRTALGAGRGRLGRQLLTETLLLALVGGAFGVLLAVAAIRLLLAVGPGNVPRLGEVSIDGPVLVFTLAVSLVTGLLIGALPALRASDAELLRALNEGGSRSPGSVHHNRLRNVLVAVQTALVVLLLISGGLLVKSFSRLRGVEPGFQTAERLSFEVTVPASKYPEIPDIDAFFRRALERLRALPGVTEAGAVTTLPLTPGGYELRLYIEGRPAPEAAQVPTAGFDLATPGYFRAMGIPLLAGRDLSAGDDRDATKVLVINQTMAERFWPGESAVGKRVSLGGPEGPWVQIVGVVGDVRHAGLAAPPRPEMYKPQAQMAFPLRTLRVVVHAAGTPPERLAAAVRAAVREVDPDQPVTKVRTLEQVAADSLAQQRLTGLFAGLFGLVALALGAVGVYGVVSYSVSQRTDEVGVRMALGAQRADVRRWVVRKGLVPVAVGVGLGVAAALALGRVVASFLYGVTAADPAVFAGVMAAMVAAAMVAAHIPARRATRVDPVVALRA